MYMNTCCMKANNRNTTGVCLLIMDARTMYPTIAPVPIFTIYIHKVSNNIIEKKEKRKEKQQLLGKFKL